MAEEVWMLQTKKADFKQIGARFRIDPVTARIIRNRGIEGEAAIDRYLNGTLDDLYDPMLLKRYGACRFHPVRGCGYWKEDTDRR